MVKLRDFLKAFFFVQLGACTGRVLMQYLDYRMNPVKYMVQSAPWYTASLITVLLTAITAGLTALAWWLVARKLRKKGEYHGDTHS